MRSPVRRCFLVAAALVAALATAPQPAPAAGGFLDRGFGDGGRGTIPIEVDPTTFADGRFRAQLTPDGKIVVASGSDFEGTAVARFDRDGDPDRSFGHDGLATVPQMRKLEEPTGLGVDRRGGILVADAQGSVLRLRPNGSLDRAFGSGGIATPRPVVSEPLPGTERQRALPYSYRPEIGALAVGPEGGIYLAGSGPLLGDCGEDPDQRYAGVVLKLTAAGALDTSFGKGGVHYWSPEEIAEVSGLAITPGGSVAALGRPELCSRNGPSQIDLLDPNGALEPGFASGGVLRATSFRPQTVLVDGSGRFVVGSGGLLRRLSSAGSTDPSFGEGGVARTGFLPRLGVAPDGSVLAATSFRFTPNEVSGGYLRLLALTPAGRPRPGFGNGGIAMRTGPAVRPSVRAVLADGNRAALVVGKVRDRNLPGEVGIAVWRFRLTR